LLSFDRQVEFLRNCHAHILREQGPETYSTLVNNIHYAVNLLIKADSAVSAIARGDWRIVAQSDDMIMSAAVKPSFLLGQHQNPSPPYSPTNYMAYIPQKPSPPSLTVPVSSSVPVLLEEPKI
jgi:hypothetical protein